MMKTRGSVGRLSRYGRWCLAALAAGGPAAASVGDLYAQPADKPLFCATLLTAAELNAIAPGSEPVGSVERGEGHSECSWMVTGEGDANTLSLTFWEPKAMAESLIPADTPEEFFEMTVKSAEDVRGTQRETLEGVGLRSALFRDGQQRVLYVLSRAGVAYFVADGLTDAQVQAVGKAAAAP